MHTLSWCVVWCIDLLDCIMILFCLDCHVVDWTRLEGWHLVCLCVGVATYCHHSEVVVILSPTLTSYRPQWLSWGTIVLWIVTLSPTSSWHRPDDDPNAGLAANLACWTWLHPKMNMKTCTLLRNYPTVGSSLGIWDSQHKLVSTTAQWLGAIYPTKDLTHPLLRFGLGFTKQTMTNLAPVFLA